MQKLFTLVALVALSVPRAAADDGPIVPPFSEDFSTAEGFSRFSVINANGDTNTNADGGEDPITWYFDADRLTASYTYNKLQTSVGADDWLITPGLQLEAGRTYTLRFQAWSANGNRLPERLEVKLGNAATVAAMTTSIMAPALLQNTTSTTRLDFEFDQVSVAESGVYYIGFHAMTDPDHFRLMLDNIDFTANPFDAAPGEVTQLQAVAAPKGALGATVSFTAPAVTLEGGTLSSISSIELKRDGELVHTFKSPAPGASLSYEDAPPANCNYTYSVTAYNDSGFGGTVETTVYVGIDIPFRPTGAVAQDNQSSVGLTWAAVSETGVNGGYVNPAQVQYIIYTMEGGYVVDELQTTEPGVSSALVTMDTEEGQQELRQFAIAASNEAGRSEYGVAALVVGASYRLPFEEHFAESATQNYWFRYSTEGITPSFDHTAADGDASSYKLSSTQAGAEVRFISGKISLRGAVNPALLFHHQVLTGESPASLIVEIQKGDGSVGVLKAIDYTAQSNADGWQLVSLPLKDFLNERYVMVSFHFVSGAAGQEVLLDNVRVMDMFEYDLTASIQAPAHITKGTTADIAVVVKNSGSEEASDYRVRLYADGDLLLDQRVSEVLASQSERTFGVALPVPATTSASSIVLRAEVDYEYDLNEGDNQATATLVVESSGVPAAENLKGEETAGGVILTWDAPSSTSRSYTEDFEGDDFTAFSRGGITTGQQDGQIGDWRLHDGDGLETFRFDPEPLYSGAGEAMAWQVFEPGLAYDMTSDLKRGYIPHSGERYLISVQSVNADLNAARSDDWLISHRLSGEEQEISFFAKEVSL
ncbi:MAG: choice-of-anchor J domain-containing protein, partial [Alloprevotella sp.]|nr:choice-of-anchor J domain-containing protein [Alloprevotella sp.]